MKRLQKTGDRHQLKKAVRTEVEDVDTSAMEEDEKHSTLAEKWKWRWEWGRGGGGGGHYFHYHYYYLILYDNESQCRLLFLYAFICPGVGGDGIKYAIIEAAESKIKNGRQSAFF